MEEIIENKIIKKEEVEEKILFVSVNDYIESESDEDISKYCYDTLDKEEKHSFCEQFHIQSTNNVQLENENCLVKNKDCDLDKCKEDVNLNSEVYKSKFNMGTSFRSNRYRYNIQGHSTKSSQEKSECNYFSIKTGEIIINIRDKPYKCNECNYTSTRSNDIRKHMRKHTGEKPYKCGECDYSFIQSGDLLRHMRIHTGEKPYKCNLCNYSSPRSDDLRSHIMRKHPAEKSYKCDKCDYSCIQLGDLGRHMKTHTGKKPYKCNVCNYSSTWSGDLRKHIMRKHTGEKPYKCSKCGYYCIRSSDLGNHMRIHIEGKV